MRYAGDVAPFAFDAAPVGIVLAESRVIRAYKMTFARSVGYGTENLVGQ